MPSEIKIALLVLFVVVIGPTSCVVHYNQKAAYLLENGVPSYEVKCAMIRGNETDSSCILSKEANDER